MNLLVIHSSVAQNYAALKIDLKLFNSISTFDLSMIILHCNVDSDIGISMCVMHHRPQPVLTTILAVT